ncbi:unnamed protein product [Cochlearia groenlandica]
MEFVKFLAKGSFGSVNLVRYRDPQGTTTFYNAVKVSDLDNYDSLSKEFEILTKLRGCPRILQCYGDTLLQDLDYKGEKVYKMAMEYASGGTLTSYMERNKKKLDEHVIKDFTRMILQGLISIHSLGYVHCDLKPDNILLFPRYDKKTWEFSYDLKISDFGMSTKHGEVSEYWSFDSPFVGTSIYMSPESVQSGLVAKTLDLWSLGCIVLEMYNDGAKPWTSVESDDVMASLLVDVAPEIPSSLPCDARKFVETCFARNLEDRGSASKLLLHPFLAGDDVIKVTGGERKPLKLKGFPVKLPKFKKIIIKPQKFNKVKILPPRPQVSTSVQD